MATKPITKKLLSKGLQVSTIGAIAGHQYSSKRKEGSTVMGSGLSAAGKGALATVIGPGTMIAAGMASGGPQALVNTYERISQKTRSLMATGDNAPFLHNNFYDNKQIFTMRQAGVSMMQQSKYDTELALQGNEAQFMHR